MATNTKIIKLTNGTITYVPVTVAAAVQYDYGTNSYTSVQEAIGITAGSVNDHIIKGISLTNAANSYNISLSGAHNATGSVSIEGGAYISIDNTTANKFVISGYNIAKNDHNHNIGFTGDITLSGTALSESLSPTVNKSTNIKGGANLQLAYQSGADTTKFVTAPSTSGHFLKYDGSKLTWSADNDTKNTAGSSNDGNKLFLVGAKSQAANAQTFSNSAVYTQGGTTYSTTFQATTLKGDLVGTINTTTTATTQATTDDSTKVATTAFVHDVIDGAIGDLAGALIYKGTIGASGQTYTASTLPAAASTNTGWVVVVANGANQFEFPASSGKYLETGDYIISNGSSWQAVTGENQVENKNATIVVPAVGTSSAITIATVDGTDIKFTYAHGTPSGGTAATANASGSGTATTVTTTSYVPVVSGISITKDTNGHVTAVGVNTKGLNISYTDTNTAVHKVSGTSGKMNDSSSTAVTNPYLNVHTNTTAASGASAVQFKGSGTSISGQKTAYVKVEGKASDSTITIGVSYVDTNTDARYGMYLSNTNSGTSNASSTANTTSFLNLVETVNGGTATKVTSNQIKGDNGIEVSGASGALTIKHSNTGKTKTEGLYKFAVDAQGHVTAGSAPTIKVTPHDSGLKVKIGPDATNEFNLFADSQFTQTISLADLTQVTAVVS